MCVIMGCVEVVSVFSTLGLIGLYGNEPVLKKPRAVLFIALLIHFYCMQFWASREM
jgi:hypothetical protein